MKTRLDQLLIDKEIAPDLTTARGLIGAGEVYVDDCISDKSGMLIAETSSIRLKEKIRYVSRGGFKLAKALTHFNIDPAHYVCLDIGASTGGFTDCLLQHNAAKVFAVDVAYGQLSWKIRQDERVVVKERFNARRLTLADLQNIRPDLVVTDVSFISLTKILPPVFPLFTDKVQIIALIKPQFELPRDDVGTGGVVTDPALHQKAIDKIISFAESVNLQVNDVTQSPIKGPKGNTEFLVYITS